MENRDDQATGGNFAEGEETLPRDKQIGSFGEGDATLPADDRAGTFADTYA